MPRWMADLLADYGMALVLLLLGALFSVATLGEQSPAGEVAARQIAELLQQRSPAGGRVLLVGRAQADDAAFADRLATLLRTTRWEVVDAVQGEPSDARRRLETLAAEGATLDVVACSPAAAGWRIFADLPQLAEGGRPVEVVRPRPLRRPSFLKPENLLNISNQIAVIAIVAVGMTLVIITGGIDLSVGSLIALSAVLTTRLIRDAAGGTDASALGMALASAAAMAVCGASGAFSALMITRCGIPPFIVTLAMMLVGSGAAYMLSQGESIAAVPESFVWLGRGANRWGLPHAVVLMFGLYVAAHLAMSRMKIGRYLYAVGGNREAARLSGVPVEPAVVFAYVACGLLAGLGGVVLASQLKSGSATYGAMYELYVIAAVVVGGASLSGGEGKMFGTLIGAFVIAVIQNGMNLTGVESYTQKIVLGLVILGAVLLDQLRSRRFARTAQDGLARP